MINDSMLELHVNLCVSTLVIGATTYLCIFISLLALLTYECSINIVEVYRIKSFSLFLAFNHFL